MERFSPRHEDLPETPPPSALTGEGICGQVKKFHAVLVEDDADDRFLCGKVLKSCTDIGDVVSYKDGQEAVSGMRGISQGESCAAGGCDTLFVIDLNMPLMDGFKLLGRIKAHPALRNCPVIVVTGELSYESFRKVMELEADAVFRKPLNREKLETFFSQWRGAHE
jgi:CheY-like chemotaxis protein